MKTIDEFRGPTRWLSNFEEVSITMPDGITYPTTEHAYQAQKTLDIPVRELIAVLRTPGKAKKAGQRVILRPDWEDIKYAVMRQVTELKFQDPDLKKKLIATGNTELIEGNTWGDEVWGVCNGVGTNWLGKILMDVRAELHRLRRHAVGDKVVLHSTMNDKPIMNAV